MKDIVESCNYIQEFVEGMDFEQFLQDEKTSSAVIRKFEIIGETAKNIPNSITEKYPHVPWKGMAGMRDRLIHGYFGWEAIKTDLPPLISAISQILNDLE